MFQKPLSLKNVCKKYGSGTAAVHALEDANLVVNEGEMLLLMGPSGSGKTTLLSIMGCILRSSSGEVRVWGEDVSSMSEQQLPAIRSKHIGFVFQAFNLLPALTVRENVELAFDIRGIRGRQARNRAMELLDDVGLQRKYNALPGDLSGGQKQRVAIARALAGDPRIILADEPTGALDSHTGLEVMDLFQALAHKQGRAVAVVTHDTRMVSFADRIVHVQDGRIVEEQSEENSCAINFCAS